QSERNDSCILGRMTPSTARAALVGVAHCGQFARNLPDRTTTLTLASVLLLVLPLFGRAARNHRQFLSIVRLASGSFIRSARARASLARSSQCLGSLIEWSDIKSLPNWLHAYTTHAGANRLLTDQWVPSAAGCSISGTVTGL